MRTRVLRGLRLPNCASGGSNGRLESSLHWLFLVFALPMVLFFVFATPPFQVPDEAAHLFRAEQLSRGALFGERYDERRSGGDIDGAWLKLEYCFASDGSGTRASLAKASLVDWEGRAEPASFPYTVIYGPVGYLPQAVVLGGCRSTGISPLVALRLARLFNGLIAVAISFIALRMMLNGRFVVFTLLSMPMPLFLMGSLSQDALLLSISALFLAVMSRRLNVRDQPAWKDVLLPGLLLTILGMGRPPLLALGVLFLLPPWSTWPRRDGTWKALGLLVACMPVGLTLLWLWMNRSLQVDVRGGTSMTGQVQFLASHLHLVPNIVLNSLRGPQFQFTIGGIFGSLGVFHSSLPLAFYAFAAAGLASAFALEAVNLPSNPIWQRLAICAGAVVGILGTYAVLHLTWSPVGQLEIDGVQGRYLIPFFMLASMGVGLGWGLNGKILRLLRLIILVLPMVGCAVSVAKIWMRYS